MHAPGGIQWDTACGLSRLRGAVAAVIQNSSIIAAQYVGEGMESTWES